MLLNVQKKLNLSIVLMAAAVVAGAVVVNAEVSYHLVRFPEIDSRGYIAITDSGVIVAGNSAMVMLLEPARDVAGNPVWDSDSDGIADGYAVTTLNPGAYQDTFAWSVNESLDVVGFGSNPYEGRVALLWVNAPAGNPPVELGRTLEADIEFPKKMINVDAISINELGQVLVREWVEDWSGDVPWFLWAISLVNPKDTDSDGVPDVWFEGEDGFNDLMVNLAIRGPDLGGCINCSVGSINNCGEVAGMLSDPSASGFVIVPEDTNGDGEPDLWFKDLNGDGWNDLAKDLGPNIDTVTLSDSGVVVATEIVGTAGNFLRWQIGESGNVDLVAVEEGACYMQGVNNMGQAVGYTDRSWGNHRLWTTYLWEPDLTTINLYDLLDNPSRTAESLQCSDISNTGCIVGTIMDDAWEDTDAFVAVPIAGNTGPEVSVSSPEEGATFDSGATINFSGTAHDAEDGDLTGDLVWTSNIDGQIGTGGSFSATLSDGIHTITASATDSGGKAGSDSISITVGTAPPEVTVDGITPDTMQAGTSMAVTIGGSGFVAGATVTFENGLGVAPSANVTSVSGETIEAAVTAHKNAKPGVLWDVRVTNPDASSDVLVGGFTVTK
ncbi:MAG: hypothetical protein JSU70_05055 [Phycisphaerales bacterium]|nr:MAG: hypothetical protein JSU70_05055 [Phycisphaerales bacterium]